MYPLTLSQKLVSIRVKNDLLQQQGVDVTRLSDKYDIENTVKQMRTNADFLTENDIELPIPKPTFMQRMKGIYP